MLTKLTKEQRSRLGEWTEKWISIGLRTGESDKTEMEKGIKSCYRFSNLKEVPIIWVSSPIVGAFAASIAAFAIEEFRRNKIIKTEEDIKASCSAVSSAVDSAVDSAVYSSVGSAVGSAIRSPVGSAVYSAVDSAVESAVESAVRSAVRSAVYSVVYSAVGSAVYSAVESAVRSTVRSVVESAVQKNKKLFRHDWIGGQLWPSWAAFTTFFTDVCNYRFNGDINDRIHVYAKILESGCYWWPNKDFVIVCERPKEINRNERGQLHNEKGMSISWPDGWGIYSLNGVTVPKWLIETDSGKIDPRKALEENNVDVQREIIRKIGAERMLKSCNAKTLDIFVDKHINGGNEYRLMRMKIRRINRLYLYYEHASLPGVWYAQPVPPETRRAIHGRAWMIGLGEINQLEKMKDEEIMDLLPENVS